LGCCPPHTFWLSSSIESLFFMMITTE
jgi:hypothetical protein